MRSGVFESPKPCLSEPYQRLIERQVGFAPTPYTYLRRVTFFLSRDVFRPIKKGFYFLYWLACQAEGLALGHIRLGVLPQTRRWQQVVELLSDSESSVGVVADSALNAAERGLEIAKWDKGLGHAVFLLSQMALAAREQNFEASLKTAGVSVGSEPSIYDLIGGFSEAMDRRLSREGSRTDIGEMAQLAAVETLSGLVGPKSKGLFGDDTQGAVRSFSTKEGFSELTHDFFARFTQRFLTYHLDRELPNHIGENKRFHNLGEHSEFVAALRTHCYQAAEIVHTFSGGWYSKTNFESGITPQKARNFAAYAVEKMRRELKARGK